VMPFTAESVYQRLVKEPGVDGARDSVHLCDYPVEDKALIHRDIEAAMSAVRTAVGLGRALRDKHKLKNRQPLATCTIVSHDDDVRARLQAHSELIADELNVKAVQIVKDDAGLASLSFKANFKTLGKKMGPKMKAAAAAIEGFSRAQVNGIEQAGAFPFEGQQITMEDIIVTRTAVGDVVLATEGGITVALDTTLTEALKQEALANELGTLGVEIRKQQGYGVDEKFSAVIVACADPGVRAATTTWAAMLSERLQVDRVEISDTVGTTTGDIDGTVIGVTFQK
jgi:isoleucyl-tRNA synthetase